MRWRFDLIFPHPFKNVHERLIRIVSSYDKSLGVFDQVFVGDIKGSEAFLFAAAATDSYALIDQGAVHFLPRSDEKISCFFCWVRAGGCGGVENRFLTLWGGPLDFAGREEMWRVVDHGVTDVGFAGEDDDCVNVWVEFHPEGSEFAMIEMVSGTGCYIDRSGGVELADSSDRKVACWDGAFVLHSDGLGFETGDGWDTLGSMGG